MRIFNYLILATLAVTMTVSSCKKDSTSKTNKDILTSYKWKYFSYKENGVFVDLLDCEKDDFVKFEPNGTYTFNPTTVKCSNYDVIENGVWTMSSDGSTITVDGNTSQIMELTDRKLVVRVTDGTDYYEDTYVSF